MAAAIATGTSQFNPKDANGSFCMIAVSYTHLDVYKRQVLIKDIVLPAPVLRAVAVLHT